VTAALEIPVDGIEPAPILAATSAPILLPAWARPTASSWSSGIF